MVWWSGGGSATSDQPVRERHREVDEEVGAGQPGEVSCTQYSTRPGNTARAARAAGRAGPGRCAARVLHDLAVEADRRVAGSTGFGAERAEWVGGFGRVLEVLGGELVVGAQHVDQRAQRAAQPGANAARCRGPAWRRPRARRCCARRTPGSVLPWKRSSSRRCRWTPGLARDRPHRGRLVADLAEQAQGRLDDRGPGLLGPWGQRSLCHAGRCRTSRALGRRARGSPLAPLCGGQPPAPGHPGSGPPACPDAAPGRPKRHRARRRPRRHLASRRPPGGAGAG